MIKRYNNYIKEDKYEDEFFDDYGSQDEYEGQDDAQGDDDMEHLLYLLRAFLKDAGIKNVSLKNTNSSIQLEIITKRKESITEVIRIFEVLKKLSNDIMGDYDCEFDIWETNKGNPLLIIDFYLPGDYNYEDDDMPF